MLTGTPVLERVRAFCYVWCMFPFPPPLPGAPIAPNPFPPDQAASEAQKLFAKEYVKDFKVNRAAERCGMSADWGYAQMRDPRVQIWINENKRRHQETVDVSIDATLENLRIKTRASITDYYTEEWVTPAPFVDLAGQTFQGPPYLLRELVPLSEWTDEMKIGCESLKQTKYGWEIKLCDKLAANVHIGRFFNMFTDTTQLNGAGGGPLTMIHGAMSAEDAARAWQDTLNDGK